MTKPESKRGERKHNASMRISVIIPALNEAERMAELIRYIQRNTESEALEVLVVDGGSEDCTAQKAYHHGARVMTALQRGRAIQMNIGAAAAEGDILYFLHADTLPPKNFDRYIIKAWEEGYRAGSFQLGFDHYHRLLRFYCWFTQFNVNAFRFGDQSMYVGAELFREIGGYDESLRVMEDNEIIHRLQKHTKFKVLSENVITSARRYHRNGVLRLQLVFTLIYLLHHLGVSQQVLVDIYQTWIR